MAVTIGQIMDLDIIQERMVLMAGKRGITNTVSFVTIMEAPDFFEWVTGGEFVLTTWYAFSQRPELQEENFIKLAQRGIAGMGIKVNRYISAIPPVILAAAEKYNIPVFAVSRETMFREIIYAISAEISNYQVNLLQEVEKHYNELVATVLAGSEFSQLLQAFSRRRRCPCFCMNADFQVLGMYATNGPIKIEELVDEIKNYVLIQGEDAPVQLSGMHVYPCIARGIFLGYLVIVDSEPLNEKFALMAKQLNTFIILKLLDKVEAEQKMLTALFDDILFKRTLDEPKLRQRLQLFGLKCSNYFRALVISRGSEARAGQAAELRNYEQKIHTIVTDGLLVEKSREIILIVTHKEANDTPKWYKPLNEYVKSCDNKLVVSMGPPVTNARDIETSYGIAKRTLVVGTLLKKKGVLHYRDYLVHTHLMRGVDTTEAQYLLERAIKPLLEQDQHYDSALLPTLETVVFADTLDSVAAKLHVHINTVRYRINKISTITGYDFFSATGKYALTTALLIYAYTLNEQKL